VAWEEWILTSKLLEPPLVCLCGQAAQHYAKKKKEKKKEKQKLCLLNNHNAFSFFSR